jgi:hypothetical protein
MLSSCIVYILSDIVQIFQGFYLLGSQGSCINQSQTCQPGVKKVKYPLVVRRINTPVGPGACELLNCSNSSCSEVTVGKELFDGCFRVRLLLWVTESDWDIEGS